MSFESLKRVFAEWEIWPGPGQAASSVSVNNLSSHWRGMGGGRGN